MSISIRFLLYVLITLVSMPLYSQTKSYKFQIEGTYQAMLPGFSQARSVRFTLRWNEHKGKIEGSYGDDFFTANSAVSGTAGVTGKVFSIGLNRVIQNVNNLSILTTTQEITDGNINLMIYMKDPYMQSVAETSISASSKVNEVSQTSNCDVGFGLLSGYCGLYSGQINKTSDTGFFCDLPSYNFRLELNLDGKTNLYFYFSDNTIGIPTHTLGGFNGAPLSTTVNLASRNCGTLPGTNASADDCQDLKLKGKFEEVGELKTFQGEYSIMEEQSKRKCVYELKLQREKEY